MGSTKMKVGSRVLIKAGLGMYSLGIVTSMTNDSAIVLMDKGGTQTCKLDRVIQILYFEKFIPGLVDTKWFREHEKLIKPPEFDIRSFFLMKKAQVCTIPLMTCIFFWANQYVFRKLTLPKLGTNTKAKNRSGVWIGSENYLAVSSRTNNTVYDIFDTELHELVHTYQYQVNYKQEGTWNPKMGGHGETFKVWAKPLKEIAGVTLTQVHDLDKIEVDDAEESNSKASMFIIVCEVTVSGKDYRLLAKSDKLETITEAKKALRSKYGMVAKYYTRTLNNPALLNLIPNCKTGGGTGAIKISGYIFASVSEKTLEAILKIAKPIEVQAKTCL